MSDGDKFGAGPRSVPQRKRKHEKGAECGEGGEGVSDGGNASWSGAAGKGPPL